MARKRYSVERTVATVKAHEGGYIDRRYLSKIGHSGNDILPLVSRPPKLDPDLGVTRS